MKIPGIEGDYLTTEEILLIHEKIILESEAKDDRGYIDNTGDLFEGAVNSIFAGFGGYEAYPSVEEKICRLCFNIISSHCFKNANKRTGVMSLITSFEMNGIELLTSLNELYEAVTKIGEHASEEIYEEFKNKIIQNTRTIKK